LKAKIINPSLKKKKQKVTKKINAPKKKVHGKERLSVSDHTYLKKMIKGLLSFGNSGEVVITTGDRKRLTSIYNKITKEIK